MRSQSRSSWGMIKVRNPTPSPPSSSSTSDDQSDEHQMQVLKPELLSRGSSSSGGLEAPIPIDRSRSISPSQSSRSTIETDKANVVVHGGYKTVNQYTLGKTIGKGSYGKVKRAVRIDDGQKFAIKIINKAQLKRKRKFGRGGMTDEYEAVKREVAIMKKLDHPSVVRLHEVIDDPENDTLYMVLELVEKGCLMQSGKAYAPFDPEQVWRYLRDIISGLEYLHFHNIIHRDIKPENLLLSSDDSVKIGDFGVSILLENGNDMITATAGSAAFMAPEMCSEAVVGGFSATKADVWATGITTYMLLHGQVPFVAPTIPLIYEKIIDQDPDFSSIDDPDLLDLLKGMLAKDPNQRLSVAAVKVHPWLTRHGKCPIADLQGHELELNVSSDDIDHALTLLSRVVMLVRLKGKFRKIRTNMAERRSPLNQIE